jgi:hypothetical protein
MSSAADYPVVVEQNLPMRARDGVILDDTLAKSYANAQ